MMEFRFTLIFVVFALGSVGVRSADPPKPSIDELVRDLESRSFRDREVATRELWKLGEAARPALEKARQSGNPEVIARAEQILEKFNWGITLQTPKEVLELIKEFRTPTGTTRFATLQKMYKLGPAAWPTVHKLLERDFATQPSERAQLFESLTTFLRREVPRRIVEGKADEVELLLSWHTLGPSTTGQLDYATWVAMRGTAKAAVARLQAARKVEGIASTSQTRALVLVARVAGDIDTARTVSAEIAKTDPAWERIHEGLLVDTGRWAELAEKLEPRANSPVGLRAFALRRAGKIKDADDLLDSLANEAPEAASFTSVEPGAVALFLNGRSTEALQRLRESHSAPHVLASVYAARCQFGEAKEAIEAGLKDLATQEELKPYQRSLEPIYKMKKARLLAQLGERDAASQLLTATADGVLGTDEHHVMQFIKAAARSGRPNLAAEMLAKWEFTGERSSLRGGQPRRSNQDPYEILFDADADAARYWWKTLRTASPEGEPGPLMVQVRELIAGTLPAKKIEEMLELAQKSTKDIQPLSGYHRAMGLALAYRMLKKPEEVLKVLGAAADEWAKEAEDAVPRTSSRSWVFGVDERFRLILDLGDALTELGRHRDAAQRFQQAWTREPENAVLLDLAGRSLVKAGDAKEGQRLMELAHLVPLGNARMRGRFLEELTNRAAGPAALKTEIAAARNCAWVTDQNIGNVWNQISRASLAVKDFTTAMDATSRAQHYVLRTPGVAYVEEAGYLNVPLGLQVSAARKELAEGKIDAALKLAANIRSQSAGHVELVTSLVPELDRLGKTKEADSLFQATWNTYATIIKAHPNSAWARHWSAWMAAACGRELEAAAAHARKAVELEPDSKTYREGLAEVLFRLKDRKQPREIMAKLVAEDPRNQHYRRMLERYKTGAFDSPIPEGADD